MTRTKEQPGRLDSVLSTFFYSLFSKFKFPEGVSHVPNLVPDFKMSACIVGEIITKVKSSKWGFMLVR